jgi:lysophospholipase L1-like esterase
VHLAPASRFANTNSEEVEIEPVLEVAEIEPGTEGHPQEGDVSDRHLNRAEEELKRLNAEQDINIRDVFDRIMPDLCQNVPCEKRLS